MGGDCVCTIVAEGKYRSLSAVGRAQRISLPHVLATKSADVNHGGSGSVLIPDNPAC